MVANSTVRGNMKRSVIVFMAFYFQMQTVWQTSDSEQFEFAFKRLCRHHHRHHSEEQYNRMSFRTSKRIDLMFLKMCLLDIVIPLSAKSSVFQIFGLANQKQPKPRQGFENIFFHTKGKC